MNALTLFGVFFALLILSMPIGYAIGIATLTTILLHTTMPPVLIVQNAVAGVDSFPLMAIPFFMLAGNLMSSGGIAKRLVDFFEAFIGHITGGLGMVTVVVCMFFAAISGSAVATVSAVGAFMIPQMVAHGYGKSFSVALTAAAGTIGVIIPPSVPFVIYGVVSGTSITDLFTAGFLPGILMGVALMLVCYIVSKKKGYKGNTHRKTLSEIWSTFKSAFFAILSPVIILGGIYLGIFTPTEAAVVSVVYSFIVGVFVYKELDLKGAYNSVRDAIVVNGATTFMIGLSTAFAALLTMEQIPNKIALAITSLSDNGVVILVLINIFLIIIGMFIDNIPATIILSPILLPICMKFGMSPVTFGIMLTMNLAIGFCTPPYGINLFVASAISKLKMEEVSQAILKFIFALLVVLMMVTFIKPITTMFLGG
ncbi:TRAP transporter large permease [Peptoniphilus equinus]|uniref:TRAP transporter large permease n=1 Tax=Peptoniphilus equinus TaxID=3016343 RepID=A0ABY7QTU8_9FIRM|nr:TRAP transporter large permease [Peptoniphilus equinus]WBW50172.1 TRAP transporter large permease [Peptoniphilus equinus]